MKKFISVILLCFVLLSALTLSSCDDTRDEAQATSAPLVVGNGDSGSGSGSGTTETDLVKGKTPRQLLEAFVNDYTSAKSFDISMTMTEKYEGET